MGSFVRPEECPPDSAWTELASSKHTGKILVYVSHVSKRDFCFNQTLTKADKEKLRNRGRGQKRLAFEGPHQVSASLQGSKLKEQLQNMIADPTRLGCKWDQIEVSLLCDSRFGLAAPRPEGTEASSSSWEKDYLYQTYSSHKHLDGYLYFTYRITSSSVNECQKACFDKEDLKIGLSPGKDSKLARTAWKQIDKEADEFLLTIVKVFQGPETGKEDPLELQLQVPGNWGCKTLRDRLLAEVRKKAEEKGAASELDEFLDRAVILVGGEELPLSSPLLFRELYVRLRGRDGILYLALVPGLEKPPEGLSDQGEAPEKDWYGEPSADLPLQWWTVVEDVPSEDEEQA